MNDQLETSQPDTKTPGASLRLFVYGTLKQGYWNHERFCRGVLSVEEAVVRGRLYELPSGIPVLEVPEADVLAHGTADPLADVATQARLAAEFAARAAQHPDPGKNGAPGGRWGPVYGELLTFDDPETHLELTMIHEVMVLDYAGPELAMIHYTASLKLWSFCAVLTLLLRARLIPRMDQLGAQIQGDDALAIPEFRKIHKSAIWINTVQLAAILGSLGSF